MASKLCKRRDDNSRWGDAGGLSLPEDMILEVLLRLPARVLRRFRCVCKGWHALISDPAFHAARRSRVPLMVILSKSYIWIRGEFKQELQLRLLDDFGKVLRVFDVRAPASLALARLDLIFVDRGKLGAVIIDPASGRDFTIVGTKDRPSPPPSWAPTLTLPGKSSDYSFGRDEASGNYKVLRLVTSSLVKWCEVATIMDGSAEVTWRQRPWGPFDQKSFSCEDKATINGHLYFLVCETYSAHCGSDEYCIAAFDLESEAWKPEMIDVPLLRHKNEEDKCRITITELKGALCMVHNVKYLADLVRHYADIWLLKDHNTSVWVMEYRIRMPQRLILFTTPLDVLLDGTLLLLNTFRNNKRYRRHRYILQLYNSGTKTFTNFMEMPKGFIGKMAFCTGGLRS